MKMEEIKAAREGKETRGETAAQEEMVTGETRGDGSENIETADRELNSKKKKKEKGRKRKFATEAGELKSNESSSHFDEDEYAVNKTKKNAEMKGRESGDNREVLKETKQEKRKKKKRKKQEDIVSGTCEIKEVESELMESLETEETEKGGKKKDRKKRKKEKATIVADLEMSCENEERNDTKNKFKKAGNSKKEKAGKESLPEVEETKDKRKNASKKDRDALTLDVETARNKMKKEKKKKRKKVK